MKRYIVQNIKLPVEASKDVVFAHAKRRLLTFFSLDEIIRTEIFKRSVDARKRGDIRFVWSVVADVESKRDHGPEALIKEGIVLSKRSTLDIVYGSEKISGRPVIIGFGPCGMFCALILAQNGYRPIVIERGQNVERRTADVAAFMKSGVLSLDSNIQFGAGGAGTFSDGKLVTRINDEKCAVVIELMHKFGAPDDVLYKAKPHVGTDYLKKVVSGIEKEIISLGGEIHYNTKFIGFDAIGGRIRSIKTTVGEIGCGVLVSAIGHSARDTFDVLSGGGVTMMPKAFSVGVRIEHLQEDIDRMLYGDMAGNPLLPRGEYSLSHKCKNGRGVYTFCMCPGGTVVAAASENGGVVTNGMSDHERSGKNANSAIAVSVLPEDYGGDINGAVAFQRNIERRAFGVGGGDYSAPAQTVGRFLGATRHERFGIVEPTYMGGKVVISDFDGIFPEFVLESLKEGLYDFDRKLPGFASHDAVLTAPETRTSSPLRIPRGDDFLALGYENFYPAGEGAGYAGGITSAGVDGINCALKIMARYEREK